MNGRESLIPAARRERAPHLVTRTTTPAFALFSGGHDSLTSTYVAMTQGMADAVVHINTGIGIDETREFVRETCRIYGWPLYELHPPTSYDDLCLERGWTRRKDGLGRLYGLPGPGMHPVAYRMLKERALAAFARQMKTRRGPDALIYVTGVREQESQVRMGTVQRWKVDKKKGWSWLAPNFDWSKADCNELIDRESLPRSTVVDTLHMSGECLCGTFASPGERSEIRLWYPAADARIAALEARVREAGHIACRWGKRPPNVHEYQTSFDIADDEMLCQSCPTRDDPGGRMNTAQAGPSRPRDPHAKTKALAALRQAAWEATQFLSTSDVVTFVDQVMVEVESDEP